MTKTAISEATMEGSSLSDLAAAATTTAGGGDAGGATATTAGGGDAGGATATADGDGDATVKRHHRGFVWKWTSGCCALLIVTWMAVTSREDTKGHVSISSKEDGVSANQLQLPPHGGNEVDRVLRGLQRNLQTNNETRRLVRSNFVMEQEDVVSSRELQMNNTENYDGAGRRLIQVGVPDATIDLSLPSPCKRVDPNMPNNKEWRKKCQNYLNEALVEKECSDLPEIVPRIYHSVSKEETQTYHQMATTAQNPTFDRHHLSDEQAAQFVLEHCGLEAYEAYQCFVPPAYRADLFRFCTLWSIGGVYLDEDIFPFVPLQDLYSPCATATVGHDFPWKEQAGKQMKILAGAPGSPIFQCALHRIVENVRARAYPESELALTGPQLLQKCYEDHSEDVAITYKDTRNAEWPYTGMRANQRILAYEIPMSSKHFWVEGDAKNSDAKDYTDLFQSRQVYRDTCTL